MSTSPPFTPYDLETGQVLDAEVAQMAADEAAARIRSRLSEIELREQEMAELAEQVSVLRAQDQRDLETILATLDVDGRADGGDAWLVVEPAPRRAQRVSATGCDPHREILLALGLGSEGRPPYRPPTLTQLKAARGELVARGIPFEHLAPTPRVAYPVVKVVKKEQTP